MSPKAKTLATCSYKGILGDSKNPTDEISFSISLNDKMDLEYSTKNGDYYKSSKNNDYLIHFKNFNGYLSNFYKDNKISSTCPKLAFGRDTQNTIWVYYGRETSSLDEMGFFDVQPLTGTLKIEDNSIPTDDRKEKEYCTHTKKLATNTPISIRFYEDIDGTKMFEVYSYNNNNIRNKARFDGLTTLQIGSANYIISLDKEWENISKYYTENCSKTKIYLNTPDGDPYRFYITSKKTSASENASDLGSEDDGSSIENPDWEQRKDNEYNLNFAKYCTEPQVARTLKFIGLLLFLAKILVPAIIIILGMMDFGKAMLGNKDDEMMKKLPILAKRIAAGVIIFFIPTIIEFLFSSLDGYSETLSQYSNCRTCILDPDSCEIKE